MIINKITEGFVIQRWDTEKKQWLSQEFVAGECVYENEVGDDLVDVDMNSGGDEPYLPFEMVDPKEFVKISASEFVQISASK